MRQLKPQFVNPRSAVAIFALTLIGVGCSHAPKPGATHPREQRIVLVAVAPAYPKIASDRLIDLMTTAEVTVDEEGGVIDVATGADTPERLFSEAVAAAANGWRFAPVSEGQGNQKLTLRFKFTVRLAEVGAEPGQVAVFEAPYSVETRDFRKPLLH